MSSLIGSGTTGSPKRMRVAVAGATGNVGKHVVRALLDAGHEVRALTRDHRKGEEILGKHERLRLVEGEGDDAGALCTACIKCDAAFLACANCDEQQENEVAFVDNCRSAGVEFLVKLGTIRQYTSIDSDVVYARRHAAIEEHLAKTPPKCHMRWVVLSPNCFMSNHLADVFGSLPASSTISYPLDADAGARLVDPRDVGELAAAMLTRPENYGALHGRKLDVSGPAEVTMGELAELYSEALGRPIRFERVSVETWVAAASQHIPAWLAGDVVKNFELWNAGELCFETSPEAQPLPARTMRQWVKEWAPRSPPPE